MYYFQSHISDPSSRWPNFGPLEALCFRETEDAPGKFTIEIVHAEALRKRVYYLLGDSVDKLGFMEAAREYFVWASGHHRRRQAFQQSGRIVHCRYHFYNFVFHTKAFLDTLSLFLNEELEVGLKGGDIDIAKARFRNRVAASDHAVSVALAPYEGWFLEVDNWRRHLIHRHGVPLMTTNVPGLLALFPDPRVSTFDIFNTPPARWLNQELTPALELVARWQEAADGVYNAVLGLVRERWFS